jgi:ribose transport system permease protein
MATALSPFLRTHQKTLGILGLLLLVFFFTGAVRPVFLQTGSVKDLLRFTGLYGVLSIGAALVIVTGGIDLSIGSLVALSGVLLPMMLREGALFFDEPLPIPAAMAVVLAVSALIGLVHGLLITKMNLQPFLVTLCGLFIYRGLARRVADDKQYGFEEGFTGLRKLANGQLFELIPVPFAVLVALAVLASLFLHRTVWGRHVLALGRNEEAARFSGIDTDRMKIICYVLCSMITGFGGMMLVLEANAALPSNFGNSYELYAIAGAVLGGCSLRGGECSLAGVVLGSALVQMSMSAVLFLGVKDSWKLAVIGSLILFGVIMDEVLRRTAARRASEGLAT